MRISGSKKGFTVAELLIVVGIIAVIAVVSFVAVAAYLRSMTKLEYDGYAKEIFIAAQNHLSMAESQGYLGRSGFGTKETALEGIAGSGDGVFYFVRDGADGDSPDDPESVLGLMLPFGSVDDTVRAGGRYIVRYHKDSATVLDVFFWKPDGRYAHAYAGEYADLMSKRDGGDALRNYSSDGSVIGWYGGADANNLTRGKEILAPSLTLNNSKVLSASVTFPYANTLNANVNLKLIITGLTSKNSREIALNSLADATVTTDADFNVIYNVILDDVTQPQKHFCQLFCVGDDPLIPGEDITVRAVAYNNTELTNVAYSSKQTTNSLFAFNNTPDGSAHIANVRHLENLDKAISDVNTSNAELKHVSGGLDSAVNALQTTDLSWEGFTSGRIYSSSGSALANAGKYKPVEPGSYKLIYDGAGHAVSDIDTDYAENAGMFGVLSGDTVKNLRLEDFSVDSKNAGALAGSAVSSTIVNVAAYNTVADAAPTVLGSENAGGLVGVFSGGSVEQSLAALAVSSSDGFAGGLIGSASDARVYASYSGGHTVNGKYDPDAFNVSGNTSGGLIGSADSVNVACSYSACSSKGNVSGGLVGASSGSRLDRCYSAGLVGGDGTDPVTGAVTGSSDNTDYENCAYYGIVNEISQGVYAPPVGAFTGEIPGQDKLPASFDESRESFVGFIGDERATARPYDGALVRNYQGTYMLADVRRLGAETDAGAFVNDHYGDWPSPETRIINVPQ